MSKYTEAADTVVFKEPILKQDNVRLVVGFAEKVQWKSKADGNMYDGCKLTLTIADDSVKVESAEAMMKTTIEDQFNIEPFPYLDKKTGETKTLGRGKLYDLEGALGFEPVFVDASGNEVEARVTRTGNKVAPKIDGVKRK